MKFTLFAKLSFIPIVLIFLTAESCGEDFKASGSSYSGKSYTYSNIKWCKEVTVTILSDVITASNRTATVQIYCRPPQPGVTATSPAVQALISKAANVATSEGCKTPKVEIIADTPTVIRGTWTVICPFKSDEQKKKVAAGERQAKTLLK